MYPIILEVLLFFLKYEGPNVLALSLSHAFWTLVGFSVRVLPWLMISLSG